MRMKVICTMFMLVMFAAAASAQASSGSMGSSQQSTPSTSSSPSTTPDQSSTSSTSGQSTTSSDQNANSQTTTTQTTTTRVESDRTGDKWDWNHGSVGVFLDYLRLNAADTNNWGLGGRVGFALHPNVHLEGEIAYDFRESRWIDLTIRVEGVDDSA